MCSPVRHDRVVTRGRNLAEAKQTKVDNKGRTECQHLWSCRKSSSATGCSDDHSQNNKCVELNDTPNISKKHLEKIYEIASPDSQLSKVAESAIKKFIDKVDIVTFEFENIPVDILKKIELNHII